MKFIQSKKIFESKIGDDLVMLDIDSGFYFGLNQVASDIWVMMQNPVSEEEIIEELLRKYEVDPTICSAETKELIQQMLEHKIISFVK